MLAVNNQNTQNSKSQWINHGSYWELSSPQGDDIWLEGRKGRVTTSVSGAMVGESRFKTAEEQGRIIAGVYKEEFSPEALERMNHGTEYEPTTRNWYSCKTKQKIEERGLIVPVWDFEIGASIDGDIIGTDGIIEIKCPVKMYYPLTQYTDQIKSGWVPPPKYYKHIYRTHLHQMQHAMAVMGKKWCIYIVNSTIDGLIFTQKIDFDKDHWNHYYPIIKNNYNKYVAPYLNVTYPIAPS